MKPLSGSGARGMMVDAMSTYGADSFVGRVASTIQGSTDTTFYILAVYFGSVGIRNTRYAAGYGLLADLAGIIAAIAVSYVFFIENDRIADRKEIRQRSIFPTQPADYPYKTLPLYVFLHK